MGPTTGSQPGLNGERTLFLGDSPAARRVRDLIHRAAKVDATVLISGESGVGKELVAREIHLRSPRSVGPFLPLNCAAIPDTLIESELFGHEAGAFTDAKQHRRGAFELAHEGTLFLDEVGDLNTVAQPKLLRALEAGEITRVGSEKTTCFDIRIVAATNHNLKSMCRNGGFRSDLYYRLCVLEIYVPPLRERVDDIPLLANSFAATLSERNGRKFSGISETAMNELRAFQWPGNVRQLRHLVERAMALSSGHVLESECFDLDPLSTPGQISGLLEKEWKTAKDGFESHYAKQLLDRHQGNVAKAAQAAGLATGSLYKMLRRVGLPPRPESSEPRES